MSKFEEEIMANCPHCEEKIIIKKRYKKEVWHVAVQWGIPLAIIGSLMVGANVGFDSETFVTILTLNLITWPAYIAYGVWIIRAMIGLFSRIKLVD